MAGPGLPAATATRRASAKPTVGIARVAQRLDHRDQLRLAETGQAQQLQLQLERRRGPARAGARPDARPRRCARRRRRAPRTRSPRQLPWRGRAAGRSRPPAWGERRRAVLDRPQPGAQASDPRLQHRGQIDVADAEAHAEPAQVRPIVRAQALSSGCGPRAHVAHALDQHEGEPRPGAASSAACRRRSGIGQFGEMAVQPLPEPLADRAPRRPCRLSATSSSRRGTSGDGPGRSWPTGPSAPRSGRHTIRP